MPIKILHIADTHLGMENYGRVEPSTGLHTRLMDFSKSLQFAVDYGIKEGVDVCLFAGDAYRNSSPSPTHQREFAAGLSKLVQAGIPVVMVVGNHDSPVSFGKASALEIFNTLGGDPSASSPFPLPSGERIKVRGGSSNEDLNLSNQKQTPHPGPLPSKEREVKKGLEERGITGGVEEYIKANFCVLSKPKVFNLKTKSGTLQIVAMPWPSRSNLLASEEYKNLTPEQTNQEIERKVSLFIEASAEGLDPQLPSAMVSHLTVGGATYCGSERTAVIGSDPVILTSTIAQPNFNYVALGHIHKYQDLNKDKIPPVIYPGSIDRVDFGEMKEDKGFVIADLWIDEEGKRRAKYEFIAIPARPFISIEVELTSDNPTAEMLAALTGYNFKDAIVKVSYTIPEDKQGLLDTKMILQVLSEAHLISGISRKVALTPHTPRVQINESLSMEQTLERYLSSQPEWDGFKDDLMKHARILERDLESES